ncbi:hypothetical protein [Mesorhizobium sp. SP-1A]|uniref:hypothetical protein n=1 Tax=Mesorhizobium sp. SP-1A TaxID=3077840 RepID=UPI0028F73BF1|nr:hypothetical protein [Mesorhizobium sp. SP-1A]
MNDPITQANIDSREIFDKIGDQLSAAVVDAIETAIPGKLAEVRLEAAIERLDHLAAKEAGWKGPDSVPMPNTVRDATDTFLRANFSSGWMPSLFIGLDADGDVTIFAKSERISLDLSIGTDQLYSFCADLADGQVASGEDIPVTQPLPDAVMGALR